MNTIDMYLLKKIIWQVYYKLYRPTEGYKE